MLAVLFIQVFKRSIFAASVEEKPNDIENIGGRIEVGLCPKCTSRVVNSDNFCTECGQSLDWERVKE